MIAGLVLAFVAQTFLVYADTSEHAPLDEQAIAGRRVWLANNCQACHQMYGFGGFLGPDLTNAASRIGQDQLSARLVLGEGQMPRYDMDVDEVDALWSFLEAMDKTGIGQARNPQIANASGGGSTAQVDSLAKLIEESGDLAVAGGFEVFQSNTCTTCHVLYGKSFIGASDLSLTSGLFENDVILHVLEHGREPIMPPTGLSADDRQLVLSFLVFMNEQREKTLARVVDKPARSFWKSIPWWEFE
ncbi:MAG: cytochrome c [Phycisphaerales bacterium]|nr:cytochrome c [Phycisphaerales bacterium]